MRSESSYLKAGLAFITVLLFTGVAFAQTGAGSLIGRVSDASGAVLPGITITASSEQMIGERQVFSDGTGIFASSRCRRAPTPWSRSCPGLRPTGARQSSSARART